jgi:hypothetical protein
MFERFGCNTPRYARLLDSDIPSSPEDTKSGLTQVQCMDRIIPQGPAGLDALDLVMRESLQCEPGSPLHLGVSYALLRMQVRHFQITKTYRIFMPDLMILYVQPVFITGGLGETPVRSFAESEDLSNIRESITEGLSDIAEGVMANVDALMHVRVFRFLTIPRDSVDNQGGKRKAKRIRIKEYPRRNQTQFLMTETRPP